MYDFYVTCAGGLEDVALREVKTVLKGVSRVEVEKRQRISRIRFHYERSPKHLLALKRVEGVFARLGEFGNVTTGRPGLLRIAQAVADVDLAPGVALYNILHGEPPSSGVAVNCTVGRGHRFSASELHQVLRVVLAETYELDESEQQGPYYVHVRIEGKKGLIGVRLSERTAEEAVWLEVPGSLTAATARGICDVVRPERGARWLDAVCRDGRISEALSEAGTGEVLSLETRADWAAAAERNLSSSESTVGLWDGRRLPVADGSVNGVFVDLGKRRDVVLTHALKEECRRVLAEHGRVVLLCPRDRELESELKQDASFRPIDRRPVFAAGESLSLYQLRKRSA